MAGVGDARRWSIYNSFRSSTGMSTENARLKMLDRSIDRSIPIDLRIAPAAFAELARQYIFLQGSAQQLLDNTIRTSTEAYLTPVGR